MATIPATFKAYEYESYGDPFTVLKLRHDVQQPTLKATDVRIRVHSAALNPVDAGLIEFLGPFLTGSTPSATKPYRIGFDVAGTVVDAGADVKDLQLGDAVFAMTPFSGFGTFAEYIDIDAQFVARKPTTLSFDQAASVPLAALTSYQAILDHTSLAQGQRLLVLGGSCATGIYAVQIAKALGAYVTATTSARNAAFVKSLGADEVIDYTTTKWVDVVPAHSIDVVYDCGMEPASWNSDAQHVLKRETGQFITLEPVPEPIASPIGAKSHGQMAVHPSAAQLDALTKLIDAGRVVTQIDSVYPFENLFDAIKKSKTRRAVGKIVLQVHTE